MKKSVAISLLLLSVPVVVFLVLVFREAEMPYLDSRDYHHIAHGLGAHGSEPYNNSIESLERSYKLGFRLMEVDLIMTSDRAVVCGHPWVHSELAGELTLKAFNEFNETRQPPLCMFEQLVPWMRAHPDVRFILDVKNNHFFVYSYIVREYPDLLEQLIPQVYHYSEIAMAHGMGYAYVIYTLYKEGRSPLTRQRIVGDVSRCRRGYGVAVNPESAVWHDALHKALTRCGTEFFVYTINDADKARAYRSAGARGVYTDVLVPESRN